MEKERFPGSLMRFELFFIRKSPVLIIMSESSRLPTVYGATFAPFQQAPTVTLSPLEQRLYSALTTQAEYIEQIVNRNKALFGKLASLKKELALMQACPEPETAEQPSKDTVLSLVGMESGTSNWSLELTGKLPEPLCKGKYFQFKVKLVPLGETSFPVEERIQLSVAVYSAEKTPKPIQCTMTGHSLVKGYPESMLSYSSADQCHVAYFKIQICEVSSHFRNGWVFLVIQPKYTGQTAGESLQMQIRPLVLENVIIRAKEISNKRLKRKEEDSEM